MIDPTSPMDAGHTTGRYVVVFSEEEADARPLLQRLAGARNVADSRDYEGQAMDMTEADDADAEIYSELGMAVVRLDADRLGALQTSEEVRGNVVSVSPELLHHVLPDERYLAGYRDGVSDLAARFGGDELADTEADDVLDVEVAAKAQRRFEDDERATWGLHATRALGSSCTGAGIRVAVLDTGLDIEHPDFAGRPVQGRSFVKRVATVQDGHGHGTHCVGTACGPRSPEGGPRYGVACEADIFVGKVLSDEGWGNDAGILAGINWAVAQECPVISMSLGADVSRPHPPYNVAGRRALRRGSLIVAAAGNNANRHADPGYVGSPANSPDVLAVGALDFRMRIARFSARSLPGRGGQVDIAGPGVAVYSCWPMPMRYHTIDGTSMATPHVSGIAALWAQKTGRRGLELWATLGKESRRLGRRSSDVGAGLVLAPE